MHLRSSYFLGNTNGTYFRNFRTCNLVLHLNLTDGSSILLDCSRSLLCEDDVWVHQASSNTVVGRIWSFYILTITTNMEARSNCFLPNVKANEVGPGEYVVSSERHTNVCDKDVLQRGSEKHSKYFFFIVPKINIKLLVKILTHPMSKITHFNTANDWGSEGRVVLSAKHRGVHQDESANI